MAGENEDRMAPDQSRRPSREMGELYCIRTVLPDGRQVVLGRGSGLTGGEYFVIGDDGRPDWDQPVDIDKELNIERPADREH